MAPPARSPFVLLPSRPSRSPRAPPAPLPLTLPFPPSPTPPPPRAPTASLLPHRPPLPPPEAARRHPSSPRPRTPRPRRPPPGVRSSPSPPPPSTPPSSIRDPSGAAAASTHDRHGGPPSSGTPTSPRPPPAPTTLALRTSDVAACTDVAITDTVPATTEARPWGAVWPARAAWDRRTEALYSAWIEKLFDAPLDEPLVFPALHVALRDPARNLLHDYLGQGEDDAGPRAMPINPDCADLPYFLRAYFAFKLGLPFGFSSCTRGGPGRAAILLELKAQQPGARRRCTQRPRTRSSSSSASSSPTRCTRAPAASLPRKDAGDYRHPDGALLRGPPAQHRVYADPYGHVLVVAKRIPQTAESGGVLLAVRRAAGWDGLAAPLLAGATSLFATDPALGKPGVEALPAG